MTRFARRMSTVHRSFIREILKVTDDPSIISFAGGLPNPQLFPVEAMREAAIAVMGGNNPNVLQYSTSEGFPPLRQAISKRYKELKGLDVDPDNIIITAGSQQCLDLVAKIFLDQGDRVVVERPGYLGAIQAFSIFEPEFVTIALYEDGPDLEGLEQALARGAKLFYAVPNFQNPSGMSYSLDKRRAVAKIVSEADALFVEDDPYGELRFLGKDLPLVYSFAPEHTVLLGTFSKITAPGFRLGWVVAPDKEIRDKLVIAKQAGDLHTSTVAQQIMTHYLGQGELPEHIERIRQCYGKHREIMMEAIERHFPAEVSVSKPEGGMFLWVTMPEHIDSMDLFNVAIKQKVAFVPGRPFFVDGTGQNTMRLNFSNAQPANIEEGISRLGAAIKEMLQAVVERRPPRARKRKNPGPAVYYTYMNDPDFFAAPGA